jgi:hypothetical protein
VGLIRTNSLFIAVGGNQFDPYAQSTVITSSDGRHWGEHGPNTTNSLTSVAFGGGQYVAVGVNGTIVASPDATNWTAVPSPTTNLLYSVAAGGGQFVAVGGTANRATILTSGNGLDWTAQTDGTNYTTLFGVSYLQGKFIAVGQTNGAKLATMLSSVDGVGWTPQISMASNHLRTLIYANGTYVAVGDHGTIVNSTDGVSWTNVSLGTVLSWRAIAYANGQYVALCSSPPAYAASSNAVNWILSTALSSVTLQPLYGIVSGENSFFVAGYQGEVLESLPFVPSEPQVTLALKQAEQSFLSFSGLEYHGYEIQGSDVLPPSWQPLVTITNASSITTLPISGGTNFSSRFYRVRLLD